MFADEAGFGRISDPASCWSPPDIRPEILFQRTRTYKMVFGAVSPTDGKTFFMVLDKCNTESMNLFLKALSKRFSDDIIVLTVDNATYHKSKELVVPDNIKLVYLPPRTPELNPIEVVWREIRKLGFKNIYFPDIDSVVNKFFEVTRKMTKKQIMSITLRSLIRNIVE
jgi:putative transposase